MLYAGLQTDHVSLMKEVERGMIAFYQDNKGVTTQKLDTEPRGPASAVAQPEAATTAATQVNTLPATVLPRIQTCLQTFKRACKHSNVCIHASGH
jgi:hypothetical protein